MTLPRDGFHRAFGESVRRNRERAGLSQADLAEAVGLTRTSITNIEAGRQRPLLHQAFALANALSCSLDALLKECGEAARKEEIKALRARLSELEKKPIRARREG